MALQTFQPPMITTQLAMQVVCKNLGNVVLLFLVGVFYAMAQNKADAVFTIQQSLQSGNLDTAARLLKEALGLQPQNGGLINLRGVLHARRDEFENAREDFTQAVRFNPELTPAWQNLGRTCQQLGDVPCAISAWQQVLRTKAGDSEAHGSLALLYQRRGQFAESLRELNAGAVDNLAIRCLDLSSLHRNSEAKAVAAVLAKQTDFTEADLVGMHGALDSAESASILAELVEGLDTRGAAGFPSLQRLAIAYEQLERPSDARKILERVAKLDPNNVTHLLELARLAEQGKDYEGALGYLAHARDLAPGSARIHFLFGLIAGELNLPIEAKRSLDQALSIDPENPNYNYAMGTVILKTRDAATAAVYLQKFVNANPADGKGHYALGLAHFASGDYDKAREQMEIAKHDSGTAAPAEYYLGRISRIEGKLEEASRRLRRSIEIMPAFSEAHTELARIALLQGNPDGAQAELAEALRLAPESFQANEQLLVLYRRTHDARAGKQAELLKRLDEDRSRQAELMLRTVEVRP